MTHGPISTHSAVPPPDLPGCKVVWAGRLIVGGRGRCWRRWGSGWWCCPGSPGSSSPAVLIGAGTSLVTPLAFADLAGTTPAERLAGWSAPRRSAANSATPAVLYLSAPSPVLAALLAGAALIAARPPEAGGETAAPPI